MIEGDCNSNRHIETLNKATHGQRKSQIRHSQERVRYTVPLIPKCDYKFLGEFNFGEWY